MSRIIICAHCGMQYQLSLSRCPKCDLPAFSENRERILTVDIAHQGETLDEALLEFAEALEQARDENYGYLRIIVGSGKINRELERDLEAARWVGRIHSFRHETGNRGAYMVRMKGG